MPQAQTPPAAKANFGEATYFGAPVATVVATASVSVDAGQDDGAGRRVGRAGVGAGLRLSGKCCGEGPGGHERCGGRTNNSYP